MKAQILRARKSYEFWKNIYSVLVDFESKNIDKDKILSILFIELEKRRKFGSFYCAESYMESLMQLLKDKGYDYVENLKFISSKLTELRQNEVQE